MYHFYNYYSFVNCALTVGIICARISALGLHSWKQLFLRNFCTMSFNSHRIRTLHTAPHTNQMFIEIPIV